MIEQVNGMGGLMEVATLSQSTLHFTKRGLGATGGLTGEEGRGYGDDKRVHIFSHLY